MELEKEVRQYLEEIREEVTDFLFNLVGIRSYPHEELEACAYCFDKFSRIPGLRAEKIMMDNSLKHHPLHCAGWDTPLDYTGHYNIEVTWPGTGEEKPFYMNAHIDTVAAFAESLFPPRLQNGILYGLGACDDKGSIASIYTVFLLLSRFGIRLPFDVVGHIVVEEEFGGNGAVAITNRPLEGQAAVDMEPSSGCVMPASRGAMVLQMKIRTESRMMGEGVRAQDSAFKLARMAARAAMTEHDRYAEGNLSIQYYEGYRTPSVLGQLYTGTEPDTVPAYALVRVCATVLSDITAGELLGRMKAAVMAVPELKNKIDIEVVFERDTSVEDPNHPFVQEMSRCARDNGLCGDVVSMRSCSDKFFYQDVVGVPTVVFGPGRLSDAHNVAEQVPIQEVLDCGKTIFDWITGKVRKEAQV